MRKELFLRIVDSITLFNPYFKQRVDAVGHMDLLALQKYIATMRMLVHGRAADAIDQHYRLRKSMALEGMKRFIRVIHSCFKSQYLCQPAYLGQFGEANWHKLSSRVSWDIWKLRLHALELKEVSHYMARTIHGQGQESKHHFGGHS